jgi:hypothetical protein
VRALLVLLLLTACFYKVNPNQGLFTCATNSDCGSGWHCSDSCAVPGFDPYCIEDGLCDPCPSMESDPANCGGCGIVCGTGQSCVNSACVDSEVPDSG